MAELCVVHLVWAPLGVGPFERFLTSYRRHAGGARHDLVVVFNGFGGEGEAAEYRALLGGLEYRAVFTERPTQDIPAYIAAARGSGHEHFCFLNSHSVLLDADWLGKMYEHARREGVGLVGATGSWESFYTDYVRGWRGRFTLRPYRGRLRGEREQLRTALSLRAAFRPFPNPHVRTNAFLLPRRVLLGLKTWEMASKLDAHRFECGRGGMTRQVLAAGLKALVVGRDGRAYEWGDWPESFTFRSGGQHNLLVSDNQTREYAEAGAEARRRMSEAAWGKRRAARLDLGGDS